MLLKKYTSRKAENMFNRLGGNKRPRSPTRPGGHEHWQGSHYNHQPYFPLVSAYWGYPQYPPWSFSPWVPYPTGPAGYFPPEWIPSRPMFRQDMHKKRARFIIHDRQSPRRGAYGKNYMGDRNRVWVKRAESKYICRKFR
jgi:hypothetical protein